MRTTFTRQSDTKSVAGSRNEHAHDARLLVRENRVVAATSSEQD